MKDRITKDKNGQLVTACIVQLADCADFKGCAFNRLCSGLTVSCFESPTDTIHVTVMGNLRQVRTIPERCSLFGRKK